MDTKSTFKGTIISIQPRIRLTRSFDEASHTDLGYAISLDGEINDQNTTSPSALAKQPRLNMNSKWMMLSQESVYLYQILILNLLITTKCQSSNSLPEAPPSTIQHHLGNWCRRSWKFTEKEDTADCVVAVCGEQGCRLRLL